MIACFAKGSRLKKWQPKRSTTDCLQYSQRKKRHRPMPYSHSPLVWDTSSFSIHLFKSNMSMGTQKPSEALELESHVTVSRWTRVVGTKPQFSSSALNYLAISAIPGLGLLMLLSRLLNGRESKHPVTLLFMDQLIPSFPPKPSPSYSGFPSLTISSYMTQSYTHHVSLCPSILGD